MPLTLKRAHICYPNVPLLLQEFWCCSGERQHCTRGWVSCLKKIKQTEAINPVLSNLFINMVSKYFPMWSCCLSIILLCVTCRQAETVSAGLLFITNISRRADVVSARTSSIPLTLSLLLLSHLLPRALCFWCIAEDLVSVLVVCLKSKLGY